MAGRAHAQGPVGGSEAAEEHSPFIPSCVGELLGEKETKSPIATAAICSLINLLLPLQDPGAAPPPAVWPTRAS